MLQLRRNQHEFRVEMMPLIDVVFLLLTFFIYAMVLMVRAELLPVQMQEFASGIPATPEPVMAITLDEHGDLFLNREPIELDDVVGRLQEAVRENPETAIYLAAAAEGETDRLPVFLELYDRLAFAGLNIKLVGRPSDEVDESPAPE
ncbi:MAG: biopolymer transporter ExbD [Planctomycetota bacterium]|nr:biopolymer transporter ExbD [Planctomycetota bacterium]